MRAHLPLWIAFAIGVAIGWPRLPVAAGDDAPANGFSAARAAAHVRTWAAEARPLGSAAHARVLDGVSTALTDAGLTVERESADTLVNLVVRPTAPGRSVWLVAHSDTVPDAPGAADDGLGLSVVTEVARALSTDGPPSGLGVLITDGEEQGLLGAKQHARRAADDARLVLNVEARGASGPAYLFQTAGPQPALLDALRASGCGAQASSLARGVYALLPNDTDFTVFRARGWWGYDMALIHGAWRYHTAQDTPDGLDARSVQQVGDCVLGLARVWLGVREGAAAATTADAALVYTQVAGETIVVPAWGAQVLGALIGGALLAFGARRSLAGGLAWLLTLPLAFGAGLALLAVFTALQPDFWDRPAEAPGAERRYAVAALLSFAVGTAARRVAGRWGTEGWHTWSGLAGAAFAVAQPTMGYVFLPGAAVSAALLAGAPRLAVPLALLGGAFTGPVLYGVYPALTSRAAPILCVVPLLLLPWLASLPAHRLTDPRVPPVDGGVR